MVDLAELLARLNNDIDEVDNLSGEEQKAIIEASMTKINTIDFNYAKGITERLQYLTLLKMTAEVYSPELASQYEALIKVYQEVFEVLYTAHSILNEIIRLEHQQIDEDQDGPFFSA